MNERAREEIHAIIQSAVQRAGGNWRQAFIPEVARIEKAINNSYIPRKGNIIEHKQSQVPTYDMSKIRRAKKKIKFDEKQRISAVDILMKLGLI